MKIFLSGQKYFALEVFRELIKLGHEVIGICTPLDDKKLLPYVRELHQEIIIVPGGSLNYETMPPGIDLGVCVHSFDYIGKRTRYKTRLGWIGYHPSLLPRHRGRSSIEWALKFKDNITGGSVYWLNAGIDRGDIERQDWIWLDHNKTAREVWQEELQPLGVRLISESVEAISKGVINRKPQDSRFSTFEPSLDGVKDIFRPDLLMIEAPNNGKKKESKG